MAVSGYKFISVVGGVTGALDLKDGADLEEGDIAIVTTGTSLYTYQLSATSAAAQVVPDVIAPLTNAGDKRWILQKVPSDFVPLELDVYYFDRGTTRPSLKGSSVASDRRTLVLPRYTMNIVDTPQPLVVASVELDIGVDTNWAEVTYATPANRAGKDFYIYALKDTSTIILSANSTVPTGYTASNSRKIGGFHCLCLSVGTISGHTLTGFLTGDILPASIWDLKFKPVSNPEGMVYVQVINKWVDIYRSTSTPSSVFGGSASTANQWSLATDYLLLGKKQHPSSVEFIALAEGSNEGTNVAGSAAKATTGGWTDTAGRRMISNYGIEDCCGVSSQWLRDPSYQNASTYSGTFAWVSKQYGQASLAGTMQTAGGDWNDGANCGQDCRKYSHKWGNATTYSCSMRGVSDAIIL